MNPTTVNPKTGKSNADVMSASNAVAETAAKMLGGNWSPGYFNNLGRGQGGEYLPSSIPSSNMSLKDLSIGMSSGTISSDSVLNSRDAQSAVNEAGNALTAGTAGTTGLTSMFNTNNLSELQTNQRNVAVENQFGRIGDGFSALDAVDASFDARLGRQNQMYNNQMQDLKSSFETQKQVATAQAAALNPYSQAQGAMTARNFTGAIENQYQKQAQRLTEAAQIAQNELEAGRYEAYTNIQNAMEESNRQFKAGMAKFMLDAQNQFNQAQQQERQFGLDLASFDLRQQEFGENRFMNFVDQFSADPQFQSALETYKQTGEITEVLQPLIDRGFAAGYRSPDEIIGVAQYQTAEQRQRQLEYDMWKEEMDLNWYQAQTSRVSANNRGAGTVGVNSAGEPDSTDPVLSMALTQALAGNGMTDTQRGFVMQLAQQQGLDGLFNWAANNKFSATERDAYKQYGTSADTLAYVANELETADTTFGPYKTLTEAAKPWLTMQRDPQYVELSQNIEIAQAQIRRGFYGTAVTDSEKTTANKFLIDDTDDFNTVKIKVRNLSNILRFANDKNSAQSLGVGDQIRIEDYVEGNSPEEIKEKQRQEAAQNVIWGVPGTATEVGDDDIANWWTNQ